MSGLLARLSARLRGDSKVVALATAHAPDPAASFAAGLEAYRAGRLDAAMAALLTTLDLAPAHFDALQLAGVILHQTGNGAAAIDYLARAVAARPDDPTAANNLGLVQLALGHLDEAEGALRSATSANPRWDRAWNNLGVVLQARGQLNEAGHCFERALTIDPSCVDALINRANLAKDAQHWAEAEAGYREALARDEGRTEGWLGLGHVLLMTGRSDDAGACFERVLALQPQHAQAQNGMGLVLRARGELREAEASFRVALAQGPEQVHVLCNLGGVLQAQGRWKEAERCGRQALALRPDAVDAQLLVAAAQKAMGLLSEAEATLRAALARWPDSAAAQYDLAMLALLRGNYAEGLPFFERRFEAFAATRWVTAAQSALLQDTRRWQGDDLAGARLLVWSEQGFGDTLMMLRFLPLLRSRGAGEVMVTCERPLIRLAERVAGVDAVMNVDAAPDALRFDRHCPVMSLPLLFGASATAVPGRVPYLDVPAELQRQAGDRLHDDGRLRVGIAWAGSAGLQDDARRSIPLSRFAPVLALPDVHWVSLQKGAAAAEAADWAQVETEAIAACDDFLDTAAVMRNLDLVISVDTAVVHLAGALGVPVWLLNRTESEWRWGMAGERTAWYPSLTIFRQRPGEDWSAVLDRVAAALASQAAEKTSSKEHR